MLSEAAVSLPQSRSLDFFHLGPASRRVGGFTLIETMIVVPIVGVLASVALPSLQGVLQRSRRSDGLLAVMQAQLAEQRYRAEHASYGSLAQIGQGTASSFGTYTLRVVVDGAAGYVLTATATGAQAGDAVCRQLRLTVDGAQVTYASGPDAAVGNGAAANRRCWSQ